MSKDYFSLNFHWKDLDCEQIILNKEDYINDLDAKKNEKSIKSSIFDFFDTSKDGKLDNNEVLSLINSIDTDKDKKITAEELKRYCEENKIDYNKIAQSFINDLWKAIPDIKGSSKNFSVNNNKYGFSYRKHKEYTVYNCTYKRPTGIEYNSSYNNPRVTGHREHNYSARYMHEADKFIGENKSADKTIEISGVQKFIDRYFKGKTINEKSLQELRDNQNDIEYPEIVVKDKSGKEVGKLKIEFLALPFEVQDSSKRHDSFKAKDSIMFNLTQLLTCIENLQPEVLDDLVYNNSSILIQRAKAPQRGEVGGLAYLDGDAKERISLHIEEGFTVNILTHEIGHTVDGMPEILSDSDKKIYSITDKEQEKLQLFINLVNEDLSLYYTTDTYRYGLKNPRELYAVWYTYKNNFEGNIKHPNCYGEDGSVELIKYFESNDCPQAIKTKWNDEIKKILEGVKDRSREATEFYRSSRERFEQDMSQYNPTQNSKTEQDYNEIVKEKYEDIESQLYQNKNWEKIEMILSDYPQLLKEFSSNSKEEKVEIFLKLRNHPTVKKDIDEIIKQIKKSIDENKRLKSLSADEALKEIAKKYNFKSKDNRKPITRTWLESRMECAKEEYSYENLLKSEELMEALRDDINDPYLQIPDSLKQKYNSATKIEKNEFLALMNLPGVQNYIIKTYNKFRK